MTGMVIIARAFNPFEARIIVATLADAGISANPLWIETLGLDWTYMLAFHGIAIEIAEVDVEAATALLGRTESAAPRHGGIPLLLMPFMLLPVLFFAVPLPLRLPAELPSVEQSR